MWARSSWTQARRERLYQGELLVFSPRPSVLALCDFARTMIVDAFGGLDPLSAQFQLSVEEIRGGPDPF